MASPIPPEPLDGGCSTIYNNTLYVYTPSAFQSLSLTNGSEWATLPAGVSATGAQCVSGDSDGPGSSQSLWVVGGSSDDPSYPGLQRFTFDNQSWTTIKPLVKVTQNRRAHAATFLTSSSDILVYAGSQDDPSQPSIQTFTISTKQPYGVLSYTSENMPVISPVLVGWNHSSALSVGGSLQNTNVFLFNPATGWSKYPTALAMALKDRSSQQAVLVTGSDGSKVLEIYDMSVSPNAVSRTVLQNALGRPARVGVTVGAANTTAAGLAKRDLSLADWPPYNSSAAPTYTRQGFSLSVSQTGLVSITGGNEQHPVSLFDAAQNTWVNSSSFFGLSDDSVQSPLVPTATSTASASSTATSSATSAAAPAGHHPSSSVVLAAVLSSVLGFIAILIVSLLLLRWNRIRKQRQNASYLADEKRMSFADRGDPNMMEPTNDLKLNPGNDSITVVSGKLPGSSPNTHKRGGGTQGSDASTARLVPDRRPYGDAMEMQAIGGAGGSNGLGPVRNLQVPGHPVKRSSGWSGYFSGSRLSAISGARRSNPSAQSLVSQDPHASERASSTYSGNAQHDCTNHGPTQIPAINLGDDFDGERMTSIVTGTPKTSPTDATFGHPDRNRSINESLRATTRDSSPTRSVNESLFSHEPQQNSAWTPVTGGSDYTGPGRRDTNVSSIYSASTGNDFPKEAAGARGIQLGRGPGTSSMRSTGPTVTSMGPAPAAQAPGSPGAYSLTGAFTGREGGPNAAPMNHAHDNAEIKAVGGMPQAQAGRPASPMGRKPLTKPAPSYTNGPRPGTAGGGPQRPFTPQQGFGLPARPSPSGGSQARPGTAGGAQSKTGASDISQSPSSSFLKPMGPMAPMSPQSVTSNGTIESNQLSAFPLPGSGRPVSPSRQFDRKPLGATTAPKQAIGLGPMSSLAPPKDRNDSMSSTGTGFPLAATVAAGATTTTTSSTTNPFRSPPQRPVVTINRDPSQVSLAAPVHGPSDSISSDASVWPGSQDAALRRLPEAVPPPKKLPMGRSPSPLVGPGMSHAGHDSMASDVTVWPSAGNINGSDHVRPGQQQASGQAKPAYGASSLAQINKSVGAAHQAGSHDSMASDVTVWPGTKPAELRAQRASMVEEENEDDDFDYEPAEIVSATSRAPEAMTAIPVPASTAMQYTVKKPSRTNSPVPANDTSWFNMGQGAR